MPPALLLVANNTPVPPHTPCMHSHARIDTPAPPHTHATHTSLPQVPVLPTPPTGQWCCWAARHEKAWHRGWSAIFGALMYAGCQENKEEAQGKGDGTLASKVLQTPAHFHPQRQPAQVFFRCSRPGQVLPHCIPSKSSAPQTQGRRKQIRSAVQMLTCPARDRLP